jgi:4-amino-4-deoxy-L-arabinose transferase-like glycosyltransferase
MGLPFLGRVGAVYRRAAPVLLLIGMAAIIFLAARDFLWATSSNGIGVRTDSVAYLWGAENMADGIGMGRLDGLGQFRPMTHWPPFYPLVLTGFELAGMPAVEGARWLGAATVVLLLLLSAITVLRMTRSIWFALGAGLLIYFMPDLWVTSLDAMTEPLYIVLGLGGALLLDRYLEKNERAAFWLSALLMALALLTRYVGIVLILAACLTLLLTGARRWIGNLKQAVVYGLASVLPLGLWMLRNQLTAGSATNRALNVIPIAPSDWTLLAETIDGWFYPLQTAFSIGAGKLLILVAAAGLFVFLRLSQRSARRAEQAATTEPAKPRLGLPLFYALYLLIYPAFVILSRLLFDRMITVFEERIAFPAFLALLFLVGFAAWWLLEQAARRHILAGAALAAVYAITLWTFVVLYREEQARVIANCYEWGRGLNTSSLLDGNLAQAARRMDDDVLIISDNLEILYFISGRHSFQINDATVQALDAVKDYDVDHRVAFVLFYSREIASLAQRELPNLEVYYQDEHAAILMEK